MLWVPRPRAASQGRAAFGTRGGGGARRDACGCGQGGPSDIDAHGGCCRRCSDPSSAVCRGATYSRGSRSACGLARRAPRTASPTLPMGSSVSATVADASTMAMEKEATRRTPCAADEARFQSALCQAVQQEKQQHLVDFRRQCQRRVAQRRSMERRLAMEALAERAAEDAARRARAEMMLLPEASAAASYAADEDAIVEHHPPTSTAADGELGVRFVAAKTFSGCVEVLVAPDNSGDATLPNLFAGASAWRREALRRLSAPSGVAAHVARPMQQEQSAAGTADIDGMDGPAIARSTSEGRRVAWANAEEVPGSMRNVVAQCSSIVDAALPERDVGRSSSQLGGWQGTAAAEQEDKSDAKLSTNASRRVFVSRGSAEAADVVPQMGIATGWKATATSASGLRNIAVDIIGRDMSSTAALGDCIANIGNITVKHPDVDIITERDRITSATLPSAQAPTAAPTSSPAVSAAMARAYAASRRIPTEMYDDDGSLGPNCEDASPDSLEFSLLACDETNVAATALGVATAPAVTAVVEEKEEEVERKVTDGNFAHQGDGSGTMNRRAQPSSSAASARSGASTGGGTGGAARYTSGLLSLLLRAYAKLGRAPPALCACVPLPTSPAPVCDTDGRLSQSPDWEAYVQRLSSASSHARNCEFSGSLPRLQRQVLVLIQEASPLTTAVK